MWDVLLECENSWKESYILKRIQKFFGLVKFKKIKTSISDLYVNGNKEELSVNDKHKANIMADFFNSGFTWNQDGILLDIEFKYMPVLDILNINYDIVEKKLKDLSTDKSPGPDKISPRIMKELRLMLSVPPSIIYCTINQYSKVLYVRSGKIQLLQLYIKGKVNMQRTIVQSNLYCA